MYICNTKYSEKLDIVAQEFERNKISFINTLIHCSNHTIERSFFCWLREMGVEVKVQLRVVKKITLNHQYQTLERY